MACHWPDAAEDANRQTATGTGFDDMGTPNCDTNFAKGHPVWKEFIQFGNRLDGEWGHASTADAQKRG